MKTVRAIIAKAPGGPESLELAEIEPPTVAEGEVEVRVRAFGLNKAESYYRSGNYGTFTPGRALGLEAVGEVPLCQHVLRQFVREMSEQWAENGNG